MLLRLAEDLERSRDQLVRDAHAAGADGNGEVELRLIADGESAVPRWAAGREGELFARAFHRELLGRGLSARPALDVVRARPQRASASGALVPGAVEQHEAVRW